MPKRIDPDNPTISLMTVSGVEGPCVYLNDFRIAGPKPWGGGTRLTEWGNVRRDDVVRAVFNCAPRQAEEIVKQVDRWLEAGRDDDRPTMPENMRIRQGRVSDVPRPGDD